jgi:hypothetical protein
MYRFLSNGRIPQFQVAPRSRLGGAHFFQNGSFTRRDGLSGCRHALKNMVEIMREVVRCRKRAWLAECPCVSLALDDRKRYTLILFACDVGLAPSQAKLDHDTWRETRWSRPVNPVLASRRPIVKRECGVMVRYSRTSSKSYGIIRKQLKTITYNSTRNNSIFYY